MPSAGPDVDVAHADLQAARIVDVLVDAVRRGHEPSAGDEAASATIVVVVIQV